MFGPSPKKSVDRECLEKVQRRAINMVTELEGHTYEDKLLWKRGGTRLI
jgi:hypothetical protein